MSEIQDWNYGCNGGSLYPFEQVSYDRWKRFKTDVDLSKLSDRWEAWNEVEDRVLDWIDRFNENWHQPSQRNAQMAINSFLVAQQAVLTYRKLGGRLGATNFSTLRMMTKYSEAVGKNNGQGPVE